MSHRVKRSILRRALRWGTLGLMVALLIEYCVTWLGPFAPSPAASHAAARERAKVDHLRRTISALVRPGSQVVETYAVADARRAFEKAKETYATARAVFGSVPNPESETGMGSPTTARETISRLDEGVATLIRSVEAVIVAAEQRRSRLAAGGGPNELQQAEAEAGAVLATMDRRFLATLGLLQQLEIDSETILLRTQSRQSRLARRRRVSVAMGLVAGMVIVGMFRTSKRRLRDARASKARVELRARQRTASLATRASRSRAIVDNVPDGILTVDSRGFIDSVNTAAARMFGYQAEEVVTRHLSTLIPSPKSDPPGAYVDWLMRRSASTAAARGRPTQGRRKDGSLFSIDLALRDVRLPGHRLVVARVREIFEPAQPSGPSVATPAVARPGAIAGPLHTARTRETFDEPDRAPGPSVPASRRKRGQLYHLINDTLDRTPADARTRRVERIACSPAEILTQVQMRMRPRLDATGLSLEVRYAGSLPAQIWTDPTLVCGILRNLVDDAISATDAGGVRLTARMVAADASEPRLEFEVTGVGIRTSQHRSGEQAEPDPAPGIAGGAERGFTVSKRLAPLLGGDLEVVETGGGGVCFRLTVATGPVRHEGAAQAPSHAVIEKTPEAAEDDRLTRSRWQKPRGVPSTPMFQTHG